MRTQFQPRWIDRYYLCEELATGGMATVYGSLYVGPGGFQKPCAVKLMHPHLTHDEGFVQMFEDEARIAACIDHPNVCRVTDYGVRQGDTYLVMELLDGQNFWTVFQRLVARPETRQDPEFPMVLARVALDACEGLHAAHEARALDGEPLHIVHRDISLSNLFLSRDGTVRVVDFGVVKSVGRVHHTATGCFKGKLAYLAPEYLLTGTIDRRADVFALGVVLWEMLAGRRLHAGLNEVEIFRSVMANKSTPLRELCPWLPPGFGAIVDRAMSLDPDQRYPTARAMADDLGRYIVSSGRYVSATEVSAWLTRVAPVGASPVRSLIAQQAALVPHRPSEDHRVLPPPLPLASPGAPRLTVPLPGALPPIILPPFGRSTTPTSTGMAAPTETPSGLIQVPTSLPTQEPSFVQMLSLADVEVSLTPPVIRPEFDTVIDPVNPPATLPRAALASTMDGLGVPAALAIADAAAQKAGDASATPYEVVDPSGTLPSVLPPPMPEVSSKADSSLTVPAPPPEPSSPRISSPDSLDDAVTKLVPVVSNATLAHEQVAARSDEDAAKAGEATAKADEAPAVKADEKADEAAAKAEESAAARADEAPAASVSEASAAVNAVSQEAAARAALASASTLLHLPFDMPTEARPAHLSRTLRGLGPSDHVVPDEENGSSELPLSLLDNGPQTDPAMRHIDVHALADVPPVLLGSGLLGAAFRPASKSNPDEPTHTAYPLRAPTDEARSSSPDSDQGPTTSQLLPLVKPEVAKADEAPVTTPSEEPSALFQLSPAMLAAKDEPSVEAPRPDVSSLEALAIPTEPLFSASAPEPEVPSAPDPSMPTPSSLPAMSTSTAPTSSPPGPMQSVGASSLDIAQASTLAAGPSLASRWLRPVQGLAAAAAMLTLGLFAHHALVHDPGAHPTAAAVRTTERVAPVAVASSPAVAPAVADVPAVLAPAVLAAVDSAPAVVASVAPVVSAAPATPEPSHHAAPTPDRPAATEPRDATPAAPASPASSAPPASSAAPVAQTGRVMISTPGGSADVLFQGRMMGNTPVTVTLPMGAQTLELRTPDMGAPQPFGVNVKEGRTVLYSVPIAQLVP